MKVLITGGAGFIGSHIAEYHIQKGDEVHVVDNLSTGNKKNISAFINNKKFSFSESDILTWPELADKVKWADRIYHMAAIVGMYHLLAHPVETLTSNIFCCERLLRLIAENNSNARLLIASTSEIYGPSDKELLSENDILYFKSAAHSKWVYATSKFTEEIFTLTYITSKQVKATLIRFFNTIGPRQSDRYGMVIPRFIGQAVNNEPITVYGDGKQVRSFCDVRDTVNALDIIASNSATVGEIINLGQDQPITIIELAKLVKSLSDSSSDIIYIPYKEAYGQDYEDILYRRPDLEKFYKLTGYKFQFNLTKTIKDLIKQSL